MIFVDKSFDSMKLIRENLGSLGLDIRSAEPAFRIVQMEVSKAFYTLAQDQKVFDVVLADPPYEKGISRILQNLMKRYPILRREGFSQLSTGRRTSTLTRNFPML